MARKTEGRLINERDFQRRITDMATRFGWSHWHVPAPMRWSPLDKQWVPAREGAGLCDLILTHHDPPRLVFMEVKGDGGKLSDGQQEFLQAVEAVAEAAGTECNCDYESGLNGMMVKPPIGVMAVWPKDEALVEQMLRSKVIA